MTRQVIGIDFGTTYSSLAFLSIGSPERPRLLEFNGARGHVPSVLMLDPNDSSIVSWGWEAQSMMRTRPDIDVKQNFKRDLGTDKNATVACKLYLGKLSEKIRSVKNLENLLEDDFITSIGVPANWSKKQCECLSSIASEAGFPAVRLLEEPVAAMHNLRGQTQRNFRFGDRPEVYMVIDFGGGTLDICIVRTDELGRNPESIAIDGDPHLGGVNFDELIENNFLRQSEIDVSNYSIADRAELRRLIQRAKEEISDTFAAKNISAHCIIELPGGSYKYTLQRIVFENLCRDQGIFNKIELSIDRALEEAKLKPMEIRRVILTGGSSKWFFVKEIVSRKLGLGGEGNLFYTERPYTDVACGLAVFIGRADEPPAKPGVWVRWRGEDSEWSDYIPVLSPGRTVTYGMKNRTILGSVKESSLSFRKRLEFEWTFGKNPCCPDRVEKSILNLYYRKNHPWLERVRNICEAARNRPTKPREDIYQLFLYSCEYEHGAIDYNLEVQNNRDETRQFKISPGDDLRDTWLGFGATIRTEHTEDECAQSESETTPSK